MKMEKEYLKKAMMVLCSTLLLTGVFGTEASAAVAKAFDLQYTAESAGTTLWWESAIDGSNLWLHVHDDNAYNGREQLVDIYAPNGQSEVAMVGSFSGGDCYMSVPIGFLSDGIHQAYVFEMIGNRGYSQFYINLKVENGSSGLYSANGYEEQSFINGLNAYYNPKNYDGYSMIAKYATSYKDIAAFSKQITADCDTDEQKVKVIHDWLCTYLAYDYDSYYRQDNSKSADASWAFWNGRAVCSGFAQLAKIMLSAVGVPCLNIIGYSDEDITEGVNYKGSNHEWNAAYYNGEWHVMDITYDCRNEYHGENDPRNKSGQAPMYTNYDMSGYCAGTDRVSQFVSKWSRDCGTK